MKKVCAIVALIAEFHLVLCSYSPAGLLIQCENVKTGALRMLCSGPCKTFYCPYIGQRNDGDSISHYCYCAENEDFPGTQRSSGKNEFSFDGWQEIAAPPNEIAVTTPSPSSTVTFMSSFISIQSSSATTTQVSSSVTTSDAVICRARPAFAHYGDSWCQQQCDSPGTENCPFENCACTVRGVVLPASVSVCTANAQGLAQGKTDTYCQTECTNKRCLFEICDCN